MRAALLLLALALAVLSCGHHTQFLSSRVCRDCAAQGVDESTHFAPHVKYEIGEYAWYRVDELPARWDMADAGRDCGATLGEA